MEDDIKEKLHVSILTGFVSKINTIFSKMSNFSIKIPSITFGDPNAPISKEHKAQMLESELQKARALAEAQRRRMHIL